jgi:hypothetical protein
MVLERQGPTSHKQPYIVHHTVPGCRQDLQRNHVCPHTNYKLKTMEEWEAFILKAQEDWSKLEARRPLRGIEEQSSGEDDGSDDSLASTKGNSILTSPQGYFV